MAHNPADATHASDEESCGPNAAAHDDITPGPAGPGSAAGFQLMVEHDPDAICVVDAEFRVVYTNPAAQITLGVANHQRWRRRFPETNRIHPEDLRRLEKAVTETGEHGGRSNMDVRIELADGSWHWFALMLCDLRDDPVISGVLIKLRNIDQVKQSELATQAQLDTLRRQNQNKSAFLSTISHEFRTPLTSIIGYSEFLAANPADPAMVAEDAGVIHREATRLSRMVDDVLLMDRVDNGHLSLNLKPLDLNDAVVSVTEAMRPLMIRHRLVLTLDPVLPRVLGDQDRLEQALTNLISNAIKFSDQGGAITVTTARSGAEIVLSVRDEGMGIAPVDRERIFQRFERVETGIAGRTVGTGLGLAIVSEIARVHDGRVELESAIGEGSTFSMVMPIMAP